jgi:hypothetical protein
MNGRDTHIFFVKYAKCAPYIYRRQRFEKRTRHEIHSLKQAKSEMGNGEYLGAPMREYPGVCGLGTKISFSDRTRTSETPVNFWNRFL